MKQSFAPKITRVVEVGHKVSRRAMLRGIAVTAVAASGLTRVATTFANDGPSITPFTYHAPQSALDDLKRRLTNARWPERETVSDWSQGVPLEKLRALVEYWQTAYDWRRFETKLNGFAQYRTEIDGLNIHFLHVRSRHANALPIILTHGWPGSVIEFFKIIDPLTNPTVHGGSVEDAFHVVAPSLPGFAFSDKPEEGGLERHPHRKGLGRVDGTAWLQSLCGPRRRLGINHHDNAGPNAAGWPRRHPSEHAGRVS